MTGDGRRVAVVGASSGLGRSIALGLAARGDRVAMLARRRHRLDAAVDEAGAAATAVVCDVTDAAACSAAIDAACDALGGLDALVYSTGVIAIEPIAATTTDTWRQLFETNVIGAATATRAAIPHLSASHGRAVYLSSVSAALTPAWPYLGAYSSSKAALDKMVEAWREEHPEVRFTRMVVGDCAGGEGHSGTELATGIGPERFLDAVGAWDRRGHRNGGLVDTADLVDAVDLLLHSAATISTISVVPGPPQRRPVPPGT